MKLKEYISFHRPALESTLLNYLDSKIIEYAEMPLYIESINKIKQTVTGGKLVRGTLILLAYESRKKTISEDSITLAAALELFHTGLLIHDDIMDNDFLRRGKPTVYAQSVLEGEQSHVNNPQSYGSAIAICIGDLAFFMGYELIGRIKKNSQIFKICALELQKVGHAQITDIQFSSNSKEPTVEEIISLYTFKTARYSFSLPLKLGCMLAGCTDDITEKFEKFGEELGVAFQIKDDELGIFGTEKLMGKPLGSDIRENKKTLFRHMLFQSADKKVKRKLEKIYGQKNPSSDDIELIKKFLHDYKVIDSMKKVRENRSISAKNILDSISIPNRYKLLLSDLVDFTNSREV